MHLFCYAIQQLTYSIVTVFLLHEKLTPISKQFRFYHTFAYLHLRTLETSLLTNQWYRDGVGTLRALTSSANARALFFSTTQKPAFSWRKCPSICRSYLDYIKAGVFFYSFWFTLMIVLITGTARISLFCMGYILACFIFLWFGEDMLLKPVRKLLSMWMGVIVYCYLVIMAKCALQVLVTCSLTFVSVSVSRLTWKWNRELILMKYCKVVLQLGPKHQLRLLLFQENHILHSFCSNPCVKSRPESWNRRLTF